MKGYTTREVAEVVGLSPRQVRSYARSGLVDPERGLRGEYRFSFRDVVLLRAAGELAAARVPARTVRKALRHLRQQLPEDRPLSAVRITAAGDEVAVRDARAVWNPESGQILLDFAVADLAARIPRGAAGPTVAGEGGDADRWYDQGVELEDASPDAARRAYRKALELDPRHADAHVNLGRLLHQEGEVAEAESHYREALATTPSDATAWFNLGVALEDLGRTEEAVSAYETSLRHDPSHADAHFNLARLHEAGGRATAALRHLAEHRRLVRRKGG